MNGVGHGLHDRNSAGSNLARTCAGLPSARCLKHPAPRYRVTSLDPRPNVELLGKRAPLLAVTSASIYCIHHSYYNWLIHIKGELENEAEHGKQT